MRCGYTPAVFQSLVTHHVSCVSLRAGRAASCEKLRPCMTIFIPRWAFKTLHQFLAEFLHGFFSRRSAHRHFCLLCGAQVHCAAQRLHVQARRVRRWMPLGVRPPSQLCYPTCQSACPASSPCFVAPALSAELRCIVLHNDCMCRPAECGDGCLGG